MANPVYLNQGISSDPDINLTPDIGAKDSLLETATAGADAGLYGGPLAFLDGLAGNFSRKISGTEANQKYGVAGPTPDLSLSWKPDEMVPENVAQQAQIITKHKIQDDFALANRPQTWMGWGAAAGGELLGTAADPLNIAASFIPVTSLARGAEIAANTARLTDAAAAMRSASTALQGSIAGRITGSALNNAAAVALTQPIILAGSEQMHQDYSFADAAGNVLMGGVLGAGIHGLGEVAGATWRSAMRAGAASLETGDRAELMNADILAADRSQVVKDLTEQNGAAPSEDEIMAEMQNRQQQFVDNMRAGKYQRAFPPTEPTEGAVAPADIAELASNGQYGDAAKAMQAHVSELEGDPNLDMTPEETEQANDPISVFNQLKGLMDDFTACVAAESA